MITLWKSVIKIVGKCWMNFIFYSLKIHININPSKEEVQFFVSFIIPKDFKVNPYIRMQVSSTFFWRKWNSVGADLVLCAADIKNK